MAERRFPQEKGSYLLWLYLRKGLTVEIGRLGTYHCKRGWYLYSGSAFGPGGLRARISHHCRMSIRPHWHIDYLKAHAEIRFVWLCRGLNQEHRWSHLLAGLPTATMPIPGFGASDCQCRSHLIYFARKPQSRRLQDCLMGDCRMERFKL